METYEVDPSAPTHGSSGPLKVSYGGFFSEAGKQFLDIGPKYDKRRVLGKDGNACGVSSINTFAVSQMLVPPMRCYFNMNLIISVGQSKKKFMILSFLTADDH